MVSLCRVIEFFLNVIIVTLKLQLRHAQMALEKSWLFTFKDKKIMFLYFGLKLHNCFLCRKALKLLRDLARQPMFSLIEMKTLEKTEIESQNVAFWGWNSFPVCGQIQLFCK